MQVETNKEKSLPRRVQSLQRFLLERLKSELAQRKPPPLPALPEANATNNDQPSSSPAGAAEPSVSADSAPTGGAAEDSSSSGDQGTSGDGNAGEGEVLFLIALLDR